MTENYFQCSLAQQPPTSKMRRGWLSMLSLLSLLRVLIAIEEMPSWLWTRFDGPEQRGWPIATRARKFDWTSNGKSPATACFRGGKKKTQPRTSNKNSTKNSNQGGNRDQLRKTVRHQFKKNAGLKDPAAVEAAKETAVRGLSNFMFQEAQRMAKDQTGAATKDG